MAGYYGVTREFHQPTAVVDHIGSGLDLDTMVSRTGSLMLNSGVDRIVQAMQVILSTRKGSRFFNPSFGSSLHTVLFEPNVFTKRALACDFAKEAIDQWEPRVDRVTVEADPKQEVGRLSLFITFRIIGDGGTHETHFSLTEEGGVFDGELA